MGRSRGGLTTKIHALVDACGLPILLKLSEGQAHDGRSAQDMLGTLGRGDILLADRAYDSDALRQDLAARGATANVKLMPNRVNLPPFKQKALSVAQSDRALLQQTQAFSRDRDTLRQIPRELPRSHPTRLSKNLDAI
jgi:transposase